MTTANKNQLQTFLFSTAGVVVMLVILLAIYVIAGTFKARMDLTEEKLYTLSPGTKAILEKVRKSDTPVQINFYCTQDSKEMPVPLKTYAQRVEELLEEYRKGAKGNIEIKKFDPKPDTEAEDSANLDGVQGMTLGGGLGFGDKIYLGMAIHQLDSKEVVQLSPDREKLLEYDISRAISRVVTPDKPVIGVMSPLQVMGEFNPMAMRMGQMSRSDPWIFIQELKNDFEVKQVEMTVSEIPSDVKVLLVIHPKNITSNAQYALDQFVLKGGKLIAFLDPLSIVDSRNAPPGMNPLQTAQMGGSTLDLLLKAWGITFDVNKVVADMNFATKINQQGRVQSAPAVLSMSKDAMNPDDVVTSQLDNALIPFGGVFSGSPAEGLKQTVLLHTTKQSQLIDRFMAEFSGDQTAKDFTPSDKEQALAIRLTGKFKTAFPDGKPKETAAKPEEEKAGEKKEEKAADTASLKESKADGTVILVGDADLIYDQFCAQVQNFFGQKIAQLMNGNIPFAQNMVEQLAGDSNLIAVRSRATMNRPFTVVRRMQAEAQNRYRAKISELEKSLQETQTKLNELQRTKQGENNQRFVLSPEQQEEIKKFQTKQAQVNKELRVLRRSLNKEIDSLETRLKWLNIAGMPMLVAISGISLALVKRKKTAAK